MMPARARIRTPEEWIFGSSFRIEPDTRHFIAALYEMPLEFVAAFEADRDSLANGLIAGGKVRGMETARAYAAEILGRMVWKNLISCVEISDEAQTRIEPDPV
jgi:hypothetical protein